MKKIIYLFICILLAGQAYIQAKTIHYVKVGGTGNGTSWNNASGNIQDMIDRAETNDEIWIAGGTYYPTHQTSVKDELSKTFLLRNGIHLYGGFAGNETSIDQRLKVDPEGNGIIAPWDFANKTILSGDIDGVPDSWTRVIWADNIWWWLVSGNGGNCSGRVITCSADVTSETILDGLSVTGGNNGGIRTLGNTMIQNCQVYGNTGNRGVYNSIGKVIDCYIYNNADAGIQNINGVVSGCLITFNANVNVNNGMQTTAGGGAINDKGEMYNCVIRNNSVATHYNGSTSYTVDSKAYGGGIYNKSGKIDRCIVTNNSAYSLNGATAGSMLSAFAYGGGIFSLGGTISNSCIFNNTATAEARTSNVTHAFPLGGGVMCSELANLGGAKTTLYNTTIINNSGKSNTTALSEYYESANTEFINCITDTTGRYENFLLPTSFIGTANTDIQLEELLQADWRLKAGSGYINAGNADNLPDWILNGTDLAGKLRINSGKIDMGAYEYYGQSSGIEEIKQSGILIYPNPASDYIIVSGLQSKGTLYFYDMSGYILFSCKVKDETEYIPVSHLSAGLYVLKTDDGQIIKWMKK